MKTPEEKKAYSKQYYNNNAERVKQYRIDNAEKRKAKNKKYYIDNAEDIKAKNKKYRINNVEKLKAHYKQYRINNVEKQKQYQIKYKYGIEEKQYKEKLTLQVSGCTICGGTLQENIRLCIDHDHETGKVRDLLCEKCNKGLGFYNDNAELLIRAAEYIYKHKYKLVNMVRNV